MSKFDWDDCKLEDFLDSADLDQYDLTAGALPRDEWFDRYERSAKDASINLRLPAKLLGAVRERAAKENVPTQRLIREFVERGLGGTGRSKLADRTSAKRR